MTLLRIKLMIFTDSYIYFTNLVFMKIDFEKLINEAKASTFDCCLHIKKLHAEDSKHVSLLEFSCHVGTVSTTQDNTSPK